LKAFPEYFDNRPALNFEVNKIREATDEGYNIVSLRLNADEETVGGLLGDGMIWYPYEWCREQVGGVPTDCYTIGPWGEFCCALHHVESFIDLYHHLSLTIMM
jgi:hypothetical protein